MTEISPFAGFPGETLEFLAGLSNNNNKVWFDAHRTDYEDVYLTPARAFVDAVGEELEIRVSPEIHADPRVNGSLFRINRDTRFSKDKTPYKDHMDLMWWEGADKARDGSGLFFRLTPTAVILGAGMHGFDTPRLDRFRKAVAGDTTGPALEEALAASLSTRGAQLGGDHYKRVPRPYPADHPRAQLLRHNGLYVSTELAPPKAITSDRFVDWCASRFEKLAPVHNWVVDAVL
jgi:uncharacterized protein (TIGR02453 family)